MVLVCGTFKSLQNGVVAHSEQSKIKNHKSILRDFNQFSNDFSFQ